MTILPTLAKTLPNIQFIVTSHSPLIVGSLEWMNIILMASGKQRCTEAKRVKWAVHGLDADQVLLTDFFGLSSTRAPGKEKEIREDRKSTRLNSSHPSISYAVFCLKKKKKKKKKTNTNKDKTQLQKTHNTIIEQSTIPKEKRTCTLQIHRTDIITSSIQ